MKVPDTNIMDIAGVAQYTTLSKSTIYVKISRNEIPFHKIGSRTLFVQEEIDEWVRNDGVIVGNIPQLKIFTKRA